jgi:DNA-binding MarR family transcriptional regulator
VVYRLDDTLGFAIHRTAVRLRQMLGHRLRGFDLTPEQFGVLGRLWEREGLSQRELAELLFKDKPTITRMLDKLDDRGLTRRQPDPRDRRIYRVYLTADGKALEEPVLRAVRGARSQAYGGLSRAEQDRLKAELDLIFANLERR